MSLKSSQLKIIVISAFKTTDLQWASGATKMLCTTVRHLQSIFSFLKHREKWSLLLPLPSKAYTEIRAQPELFPCLPKAGAKPPMDLDSWGPEADVELHLEKIDCFSKGLCTANTRASSLASNSDLCSVILSWVGFLFTVVGNLASTNWNNFAFNIQSHRVICCDAGTVSLLKNKSYI